MGPKRGLAIILASLLAVTTVVWAADTQTEAGDEALLQTEADAAAETEADKEAADVVQTPEIVHFYPWMTLALSRQIAQLEQEKAMLAERADMKDQLDKAVADALLQAQSEKEAALAQAESDAQSALDEALNLAKVQAETELALAMETAQSEKEAALAQAESEKEAALAQAQSEKEAALAQAETEKEQEVTRTKEQAQSEKEAALAQAQSEKEAALAQAETEKEQEVARTKEQAQSEKEAALAQAQSEKEAALAQAETEKEQEVARTKEQAQSELEAALNQAETEKEQALADALEQWESEQQAKEEAEALATYNSSAWLEGTVPIRSGAEKDSAVLALTGENAPVTVLAQKDDVYLVDYYGVRGYVDRADVTVPDPMEEEVTSAPGLQSWCRVTLNEAATHLNVRSAPGTENQILDRLSSEEIVYLTGNRTEDGSWAEVIYDDGGNTGWCSTKYLTERAEEGEPEELTRLMYYADYDAVADLLRRSNFAGTAVLQNGREVTPETAIGYATVHTQDSVYTGEVLGGQKKGQGTQLRVYGDTPNCYERITGDWDGDTVSGTVTWSYVNTKEPEKSVVYFGDVVDGYWNKDVIIRTAGQDGKPKYFYCYADHGAFKSYGEKDGMFAIAKAADGELLYVPSDQTVNDYAAERE